MAAPAHETYSIVIVDDVPEIREILGFLLEESGWFRVAGEAGSGEAAIAAVAKHHPDLVLLDLDLPDMTGWDALPALREAGPDAAVVILSGNVEDLPPADTELTSLADAVLEKGMSNRHLITRLLEVVGGGRLDGAATAAPAADVSRSTPAIEDAAAWLAAVLNSSMDAMTGTLLDGTIVSWNPAAERLYGYARDDMIGRSIRTIVPADRQDEIDKILAMIARGDRIDGYETVRVHKDGARVDVNLAILPVTGASGDVIGASTAARDITSRRHTEAALARAITQLERRNRELLRSNEELDSFAAVASHDLAQPLQVAYGFLDMLKTDYAEVLPDRGQQWLQASLSSLDRMRNLVRDILRYARTGAGEPNVKPIALADLLDVAVTALAVSIEERGARVVIDVADAQVVGDPGQLALVFQNLVANAVKFVPAERTPEVAVTATAVDDDVVVRVADNGVGIPADQRTKVFEMFQRSSSSIEGGYAGTGLGLAIVKKIVVRHGGSVWADHAPGGGTVVAVRLPATEGRRGM